jgi:hypothetical protein
MRSFKLFGVKNGGSEIYIDTIASPYAGKAIRERLRAENHFDYLRCRDCLGGLRLEINLATGRKTA